MRSLHRPLVLSLTLALALAAPALAGDGSSTKGAAPKAASPSKSAGPLGRLATRADLQGTWRRDPDASRAHLMATMSMTEAQARQVLDSQPEQTLTFAGDQVESRKAATGPADWKGTFRVEGRDLTLAHGKQTEQIQVGVKGPGELVLGMMGVPTGVYRKQ